MISNDLKLSNDFCIIMVKNQDVCHNCIYTQSCTYLCDRCKMCGCLFYKQDTLEKTSYESDNYFLNN